MFKMFRQRFNVSHLAQNPQTVYFVKDKMRYALADDILHVNMTETQHEFHKEYSIDLIVATERDFFEAVEKYAERMRYGSPAFLEDMEKINE